MFPPNPQPRQEAVQGIGLLFLSLPRPAPAVRPHIVTQGITDSQDAYRLERYHCSTVSGEVVPMIIPVALQITEMATKQAGIIGKLLFWGHHRNQGPSVALEM